MTERPVVPRDADERTVLTTTLVWLRRAVVHKASGVDRGSRCRRGRGVASDLGQLCARERRPTSRRWVLVHMTGETARHAGHADIFREHIDGLVGE